MSSLNSIYFKKETLETLVKVLGQKNQNGIEITVSINDESNQYGQNIYAFVSQTKEERESEKPIFYVGNGNTFWTDGKITVIKKDKPIETKSETKNEGSDVPFNDELPF